jgi:indole-3-acetate monooxygenase
MNTIEHPSAILSAEIIGTIRKFAMEAEELKQLHQEQLNIIYKQNWFRLFVPKQYGGLDMTLPGALKLEEAIAYTDGSAGWTVTLCAGAGWFVGFLAPELSTSIFANNHVCLAGSGKSNAVAKKVNGGYIVSGTWDYATGSNHATAFTANALIESNGELLCGEDGQPVVQSFLFLKDEVQVHVNWKRMGMIATASNSFSVEDLFVPEHRSFIIDQSRTDLNNIIYQYPFLQFAETTLAVNSSGMAMRFIELSKPLFDAKNNPAALSELVIAEAALEAARSQFYAAVELSWQEVSKTWAVSKELLHSLSSKSKHLAKTARKAVDELFPYCGMQAADPGTEINRVWRNLHTASLHAIFNV